MDSKKKGAQAMRGFWIKTVSLLGVVCVLAGYDKVLAAREKDEEIARLNARVEAMEEFLCSNMGTQAEEETEKETKMDSIYADGEWEGEAQGFGGPVSVKVTVEGGKLTQIEVLSAEKEDQTYLSMAEAILPAMRQAQSPEVDTISGATFSSQGLKDAVMQALEKAEK